MTDISSYMNTCETMFLAENIEYVSVIHALHSINELCNEIRLAVFLCFACHFRLNL